MAEIRKSPSIARKAGRSWLFRLLFTFLAVDLCIVILDLGCMERAFERHVYGLTGEETVERQILYDARRLPQSLQVRVTRGEDEWLCPVGSLLLEKKVFYLILLGVEILAAMASVPGIRRSCERMMRPLERLARDTRSLSEAAQTLESEIGSIRPENPEARLSTGLTELKGLEEAVNELLRRMRQNSIQQAQFVSDASHELRTPISVIQGYAGMLKRWGSSDEKILKESVDAICSESEYMTRLVEQLLFLARGDNGKNTLRLARLSVTDLIREAQDDCTMIYPQIRFQYETEDNVETIGDKEMLKQCLRILCENAARYTAPGGKVTLRAYCTPEDVCMDVEDTGIGINEEDMQHIFDRFYRSDKARERVEGGSGLGLAIAKWIVDRHDGHFDVLSVKGIGSRFTIHLRAAQDKNGMDV